ncbi:hypothetical protein HU200_003983 [Digitaria exilis]|uniref:Uncharacterized protein n=1 Tax=Digitaria exilis TaxID=1010633 RepID=A0A835KTW3_9POAL|nr:hypothetical protein HU200_003983 [Digitaria exilis]
MLRGFTSSVLCSRAILPLAPPPRFLGRLPHQRAVSSCSSSSSSSPLQPPPPGMEVSYKFGPYKIDAREVFHATPLSYAMVNLRPLLPGNIPSLGALLFPPSFAFRDAGLVVREVKRFADLSSDETSDLWITAKEVGIDVKEKELKEKLDLDIERKDRSMEEMAHEANEYVLFSPRITTSVGVSL